MCILVYSAITIINIIVLYSLYESCMSCYTINGSICLIYRSSFIVDERVVFCYLSELQNNLYEELLKNPDVDLIVRQSEPCDCGNKKTRGKCCYQVRI